MGNPIGKTNLEKYTEASNKLDEMLNRAEKYQSELVTISDKAVKTKEKTIDKIVDLSKKIEIQSGIVDDLYKIKDQRSLSDSAKTFLCDIYTSICYHRKRAVKSKYLEKGNLCEEEAITLYCQLVGEFFKKNKERKENDFVEGECDFPFPDQKMIHDTKVSWDIFTFNRNLAKDTLMEEYDWQGQGYMYLWGYEYHRVIYALLNTPDKLIKKEKDNLFYSFIGSQEEYEQACVDIEKNMKYDDIPIEERCIIFDISRDEDKIKKIPENVMLARECLTEISMNKRLFKNIPKSLLYELENKEWSPS